MDYSARWRGRFGRSTPEQTQLEAAFLRKVLPLPAFSRVLDVPRGSGRHAVLLESAGYDVLGVDNDRHAVADALAAGVEARIGDMRRLGGLGSFDAVVNMWASFGFFDPDENERTLRGFASVVRMGGRVVVDTTDRAFVEPRQGERDNSGVLDRKWIEGGRLHTELTYPDGARERFDWQAFDANELAVLGEACGLTLVLACAGFDPEVPARGEHPRMQLVFARVSG